MTEPAPNPAFSLAGRTVVVVGGGGLIGREVSAALVGYGATVHVGEPDGSTPAEGTRALAIDMGSPESVNAAFAEVLAASGRIDGLVNCAFPRTADWATPVEKVSKESWDANVEMQLGGTFLLARAAAEIMAAQPGGGSIVNFGSIYGVVGPDFSLYEGTGMVNSVAYSAIKSGVIGLTRYLATRYAPNVRVNAVSPGGVYDGQPDAFVERYAARTPLGRMAEPGDVAGTVVFLLSDASSYLTGQNLMVDGGWTAW